MVKVNVNKPLVHSMIRDIVFVLVVLGLLFIMERVYADGINHDSSFYGKDVIVKPSEIDVWVNYNGIWMKELPRVQLPNGHFMLDKHNINYWRDFDEWPCYYPIWANDGGKCINPGDTVRDYYVVDIHNVPEPGMIELLCAGLFVMGFRDRWHNREKNN